METEKQTDSVMDAIRKRVANSGLTYQELGEKMGYAPTTARQAVSQFLKSGDPRVSMVRKFAAAVGISVQTLLK
jgi:transcriptional regulator with XRE-family HTH domain